jgi:hypothetical protein
MLRRVRFEGQSITKATELFGVSRYSGAALYNPIWTSAVKTPGDFGLALVGFVLLIVWRAPPLVVALIGALGGIGLVYLPS